MNFDYSLLRDDPATFFEGLARDIRSREIALIDARVNAQARTMPYSTMGDPYLRHTVIGMELEAILRFAPGAAVYERKERERRHKARLERRAKRLTFLAKRIAHDFPYRVQLEKMLEPSDDYWDDY